MTKDEFLSRLSDLLACLPTDQIEETKQFYVHLYFLSKIPISFSDDDKTG
ncbi:hypothetical protein H6A16_02470 [Collinsella tanakaei]|nr:hypothetical protein [Collinsella tanakaei]MBM6778360.1 hypothetical protein [Collinsella tanakaei]